MTDNLIFVAAVVGTVLAIVLVVQVKRMAACITNGEIHALEAPDGEGLVGFVDRSEKPILFWVLIASRAVILAVMAAIYFIGLSKLLGNA